MGLAPPELCRSIGIIEHIISEKAALIGHPQCYLGFVKTAMNLSMTHIHYEEL